MLFPSQKKSSKVYPSDTTIKKLFAFSNKKCCMPSCNVPVFDQEDNLMVQIAHIYPVGEEIPRYDRNIREEQLAHYNNLLLLCRNCHGKVDSKKNEHIYTVDFLVRIKSENESPNYVPIVREEETVKEASKDLYNRLDKIIQYLELDWHLKQPVDMVIDQDSIKKFDPETAKLNKKKALAGYLGFAFGLLYLIVAANVKPLFMLYKTNIFSAILHLMVTIGIPAVFIIRFSSFYKANKFKPQILPDKSFILTLEDNSVIRYERIGKCPFPDCNGQLRLQPAPPMERKKSKLTTIVVCNCSPLHSFVGNPTFTSATYKPVDYSEPTSGS